MRFLLTAALTASVATASAQTPPPAAPPTPPSAAAQPPMPVAPPGPPKKPLTQDNGRPVGDDQNTRTAGENGPVLLDNVHLLEKLARFDRERIPPRVVHARGAGVHGEFEATADFSAKTKAKLFAAGKKTPVFVRFSVVIPDRGGAEQARDPRGFAVKFYTEEGNWDLVGNNLPVFFVRDALKFPDLIHAFKPSPVTNQQDFHRVFDFLSLTPESMHMITYLWSDRGTPKNYRQMEGFGVNALKLVNANNEVSYVKFNWRSGQGVANNTQAEAETEAGKNPAGFTADLYANVQAGKFPTWELKAQTIPAADLDKFEFDPLDDTKVWPGVPEVTVGKLTLNKVPDNFFQLTEQAAYDPASLVPGIEASEDKLLQGRLFSYNDAQRYRIGANYLSLPVNRPASGKANNNADGRLNAEITPGDTNYEPSHDTETRAVNPPAKPSQKPLAGAVVQQATSKPLNFKQAGELYQSFTEPERAALIKNLSTDLNKARLPVIKEKVVAFAMQADPEYGTRLAEAVGVKPDDARKHFEAQKSASR